MGPLASLRTSILVVSATATALAGCGRDQMLPLGQTNLDAGVFDGDIADVPVLDVPIGDVPVIVDVGFFDAGIPDVPLGDGDVIVDVGFPDTGIPDTGLPDVGIPDTGLPDAFVPDVSFPDAFVPDVSFPDAFVPDVSFPDVGFPDASVPDAFVPDSGVPCPLGCAFLDDPCNVGVCAPDGVTCVRQPRNDGTACDDGNLCTTGSVCQVGFCTLGAPVDCSAAGDDCNVGVCDPSSGQCVPRPLPDGTVCDDNTPCTTSGCVMGACISVPEPPPLGDTCGNPAPLNISPGLQSQTGTNECASDASPAACAPGAGGADLVYESTFAETRRIRLETVALTGGSPYDTVIYANEGFCGPSPLPVLPICDDNSGQGNLSLVDDVFSPGTWFFTVDAADAAERGDYELLVEVDPHDTCANPSVITVPALGQTETYFGNTSGNTNDYTANCASQANSPDQVWAFRVTTRSTLRFETVQPASGRYDTALHIREACTATVAAIACDDDLGQGTFSLIERTFDPGTYYLMVDGFASNQAGEYQLEVTHLTPTTPLIFPATGDGRQPLSGDFTSSGEFVEGIRNIMMTSVSRLEIDLTVDNRLTCSGASFRVRLNNTQVGSFFIRQGDTRVNLAFNFSPVFGSGGRYNIRYEMQNNVPGRCGSVVLPDDISTVGLGN